MLSISSVALRCKMLGLIAAAAAALPDSVVNSEVTWTDADFKGELGSFPLGNGDVSANVWIESTSGDLLYYVTQRDSNSQSPDTTRP